MSDDSDKRQEALQKLQEELKGGLSRRGFLDRLKGAGVGFGAAFALGVGNAGARQADAGVSIKSTNPAVDDIVTEGKQAALARDGEDQPGEGVDDDFTRVAYRRFFRRFYRRGYRRVFYRRFYRRGYRRVYRRGYRRFYRRF